MATGTSQNNTSSSNCDASDRLRRLYPAVDEDETPLPRYWSPKDKFNYIGLSQGNLRVHYKGVGKTHKDAASVRANYPIPASCGIYYFEVRVISKGRDGYMGIGLSAQGVNMNRLPGWDKHSYGYHGDDGNSFCSSGAGQPYGPTFTTGDTIGCCVNLIDNTCFYTKNGVSLGIAFTDLPPNLYPTVGLQTPGEAVEANFGQTPFVFNIEDYMKEWRLKTRLTIERFPVSDVAGEFQTALHKIVSSYLVHHGYCLSAQAFSKSTDQPIVENIESIRNRQKIQKLVLAGRMGEAIETTQALYPKLLDAKPDLLFMLKCRQFVEMVNGTDSEIRNGFSGYGSGGVSGYTLTSGGSNTRSIKSFCNQDENNCFSPAHHPYHSIHSDRPLPHPPAPQQHVFHFGQQQQTFHQQQTHHHTSSSSAQNIPGKSPGKCQNNQNPASQATIHQQQQQHNHSGYSNGSDVKSIVQSRNQMSHGFVEEEEEEAIMNSANTLISVNHITLNGVSDNLKLIDGNEMDFCDERGHLTALSVGNSQVNGTQLCAGDDEHMEVDAPQAQVRQMCGGNEAAIEKMLAFGRELKTMSQKLRKDFGKNEANKKRLQDAFSLLAYSDPWNSPLGSQLLPVKREPVCAALNSAILESKGLPKQPPLEVILGQARQCNRLMSKSGIGACAFASLSDYLH